MVIFNSYVKLPEGTFCYMQLVGGLEHFLFSISYMGCHPSHWRTPSFFKMVIAPPTSPGGNIWELQLLFLREIGVLTCEISNQPAAGWLLISKTGPISFGLSKHHTRPQPNTSNKTILLRLHVAKLGKPRSHIRRLDLTMFYIFLFKMSSTFLHNVTRHWHRSVELWGMNIHLPAILVWTTRYRFCFLIA